MGPYRNNIIPTNARVISKKLIPHHHRIFVLDLISLNHISSAMHSNCSSHMFDWVYLNVLLHCLSDDCIVITRSVSQWKLKIEQSTIVCSFLRFHFASSFYLKNKDAKVFRKWLIFYGFFLSQFVASYLTAWLRSSMQYIYMCWVILLQLNL